VRMIEKIIAFALLLRMRSERMVKKRNKREKTYSAMAKRKPMHARFPALKVSRPL
jgi:hypothetical protein